MENFYSPYCESHHTVRYYDSKTIDQNLEFIK